MTVRNLVVVGVGLIGGSLAAAVRAKGLAERIIGIETNPQSANYALAQGLVDEIVAAVPDDTDLCALCVPSDLVAEWRIRSICSLIDASFSIYVSERGTYASGV